MLRQPQLVLPFLVALIANCDSSRAEPKTDAYNEPAAVSREDRELLDKIKARERAKAQLEAQPSHFISGGRFDVFDKGIINSYTLTTAIEFKNASEFDVTDIAGKITYQDENGAEMATVPFTANGELRAGQTVKLKVEAGEITGQARKGRTHVERLRIIGGI